MSYLEIVVDIDSIGNIYLTNFSSPSFNRIDGGKYNTIGTRRTKPLLMPFNGADYGPTSLNPPSPTKKRSPQFLKNHATPSMSNKLFRRSVTGKQQQQQPHTTEVNDIDANTSANISNVDTSLDPRPSMYKHKLAKSSFNLCDDEKLSLSLITGDILNDADELADGEPKTPVHSIHYEAKNNFCTLPRRVKPAQCSFHTVVYEKGPGKKKLGFTVVGGTDTGAVGIFIKSILPTGQAGQDGRLKAGDEILAVNGQVCHDLSHEEAVKLFKSVKCGEIALQVYRRNKPAKLQATP